MRNAKTRKVALAGLLTALAAGLLLLGSLLEMLDISMAALAALVVMVALIELKWKWALGVYAAASLLSLLILPTAAGVVFAGFLGYYPVLKTVLDRIRNKPLQWAAKIGCFALFTGVAYLMLRLFADPNSEWLTAAGWLIPIAAVTFVVFDFCLSRLAVFYLVRIRKHLPGIRE